jgi:hypothetical protein
MNNELLIRKMECIYGLYSHPDVAKFIFNVLLQYEEEKSSNGIPFGKFDDIYNNKNIPTYNFNQPIYSFGNNMNTGNSFGNNMNTGNSFGNTMNTGNSFGNTMNTGSSFGNSIITGSSINTETNVFNSNYSNNNSNIGIETIQNDNNNYDLNFCNSMNTFIDNNLNKKNIFNENSIYKNKNNELYINDYLNFKIIFAFDVVTYDFLIFNKNNNKTNYTAFKNYKTKKNLIWLDDNYIFEKIILNLPFIQTLILNNDNSLLEQIHYFLKGFEKFLLEIFIPSNKSRIFMEYIKKFISLPVLMAFSNEFENTIFSYKYYLMRNNNINVTFYQKYIKDKNIYLKYMENYEKEIDYFLNIMNNNYYILNFFLDKTT